MAAVECLQYKHEFYTNTDLATESILQTFRYLELSMGMKFIEEMKPALLYFVL